MKRLLAILLTTICTTTYAYEDTNTFTLNESQEYPVRSNENICHAAERATDKTALKRCLEYGFDGFQVKKIINKSCHFITERQILQESYSAIYQCTVKTPPTESNPCDECYNQHQPDGFCKGACGCSTPFCGAW